ncbi:MAG: hypothetical protein HQ446_05100 [Polaromonas sp.]|nr:hypothetical protein [Polaromonas sp.]
MEIPISGTYTLASLVLASRKSRGMRRKQTWLFKRLQLAAKVRLSQHSGRVLTLGCKGSSYFIDGLFMWPE